MALSLFIGSAFAKSTYECKSYSVHSKTPIKDAISLVITTDTAKGMGTLTIDNEIFSGQLIKEESLITLDIGEYDDRTQFNIQLDTEVDILQQYVESLALNYGMSPSDKEILNQEIKRIFGDKKINGTQLVLLQVSSLLSCLPIKD